jgi:hypothetical protein
MCQAYSLTRENVTVLWTMMLGLCALILGMDCEIKYWQTLKVQYGHIDARTAFMLFYITLFQISVFQVLITCDHNVP